MRSPLVGDGRISQRCILRVSTVAKYLPRAFPDTHPWQDFRLMYDKRGLGRKNPLCGNISPICIQNELVLARFTRRVSKKPCKPLFGNTHSENLARKDPPFPSKTYKSYIARISCHPVSPNRAKSPAPDRLHLQSPGQSALPPTSHPHKHKKGDPVGSPFNSGTDQKNQLKVIVDDPYLYRSSFSFAAS